MDWNIIVLLLPLFPGLCSRIRLMASKNEFVFFCVGGGKKKEGEKHMWVQVVCWGTSTWISPYITDCSVRWMEVRCVNLASWFCSLDGSRKALVMWARDPPMACQDFKDRGQVKAGSHDHISNSPLHFWKMQWNLSLPVGSCAGLI